MSAASELQSAVVAALGSAPGIGGIVAGVFDGPPARAAFPYLVIGDGLMVDWSTKTERGREHRLAITAWDEAADAAGPGDLLLLEAGAGQLHLAVLTTAGHVHADAGLRCVVETPGRPMQAVLGAWREGN